MPRPLRVEFPGAWYHVVNRVVPGISLTANPEFPAHFLALLSTVVDDLGVECHGYCFLPDQFHLLLHTPRGNLSRVMRQLNGMFTQFYNQKTRHAGMVFRSRFKSVLLEPGPTIYDVHRYLHWLPQFELGELWVCYHWTSYPYYLDDSKRPSFLKTDTILRVFSKRSVDAYRYDMAAPFDPALLAFYRKKKWAPILGSAEFVASVKDGSIAAEHQSETQRLNQRVSMAQIVDSTALIFRIPTTDILESRRGRNNDQVGRSVAMYLCRHVGGYTNQEIADHFQVGDHSAVSVRLKRFKDRLDGDAMLQQRLRLLRQTVGRFKV